jgi:RNA polymerase sigma-70 factor (ECF subfamily)
MEVEVSKFYLEKMNFLFSGGDLMVETYMMEPPDAEKVELELLQRLRRRDQDALGQLSGHFGPSLMRAAFLFLNDRDAAEDMTQETLIAAWDGTARMDSEIRLRPWLFGILFNRCRKFRRSLWRRLSRQYAAMGQKPVCECDENGKLEQLEAIRHAIQRLEENFRMIVILRYERGLDVAETAQALGLPEGTVKSRTHTAIEKLKKVMGNQYERDE